MVEINNLTKRKIPKNFLEKVAKIILKDELKEKENLSIVFVGEKRIKELNKIYRKKNKITDVLSFQYDDLGEQGGEIVICLEEVEKNAKIFNSTFKKELTKILIHGILHLLGYDHEKSKKEAEEMGKKQNYYFLKNIKN